MNLNIKKVKKDECNYPNSLKNIPGCPETLFCKGGLPIQKPAVSIVGTRKASKLGLNTAERIVKNLVNNEVDIISGLALGIDCSAHKTAIKNKGKTFAVLAHGLDYVYPQKHKGLAKKILETGGGLISEHPEGVRPKRHYFLERNRIISGLSLGVVIIEAPLRSGTLSTANHALEQGKEVFVIPGPSHHSNYFGSHKLIRDGARLVTTADDILEDLNEEINQFKNN